LGCGGFGQGHSATSQAELQKAAKGVAVAAGKSSLTARGDLEGRREFPFEEVRPALAFEFLEACAPAASEGHLSENAPLFRCLGTPFRGEGVASAAEFFGGRDEKGSRAWSPCLKEFWLAAALPSGVRGPVERWALRRLARICFSDATRGSPDGSVAGEGRNPGCGNAGTGEQRKGR
jgi:hypothetical protein